MVVVVLYNNKVVEEENKKKKQIWYYKYSCGGAGIGNDSVQYIYDFLIFINIYGTAAHC